MPKLSRRHRVNIEPLSASTAASTSPRIVVRAATLLMSLVERDEIVTKLGGEATKTFAMDKMHDMASKFFAHVGNLDRFVFFWAGLPLGLCYQGKGSDRSKQNRFSWQKVRRPRLGLSSFTERLLHDNSKKTKILRKTGGRRQSI